MTSMDPLLQALLRTQEHYQLFPNVQSNERRPIIVGVSGGADSVCLLHTLMELEQQCSLAIHVAHLDHNLRPESSQDADFVEQLAAQFHLPYHSRRLPKHSLTNSEQKIGIEDAGRRARYEFLLDVALQVTPSGQIPRIVVAHHANDQAETLLMNLIRGSGLRGLAGMKLIAPFPLEKKNTEQKNTNAVVIRPLLHVSRREIMRYLQDRNLTWREDATNQDTHYLRNQIRHEVMPLIQHINSNIVETLSQTAQQLRDEAERVTAIDQATLQSLLAETLTPDQPQTRVVLALDRLQLLGDANLRGVLRHALTLLGADHRQVGFANIERLRIHLRQPSISNSGPHPLADHIHWTTCHTSILSSAQARVLSLHQTNALPIMPNFPHFALSGMGILAREPQLYTPDKPTMGDWVLSQQICDYADLPLDWKSTAHRWQAYLDADKVGDLSMTVPTNGMRFAPLGMGGKHKAVGDLFTDRKIPPFLRAGWPVLVQMHNDETKNEMDVVWVCGLQVAHGVRVTDKTKRASGEKLRPRYIPVSIHLELLPSSVTLKISDLAS
ncbi:MAG: tRNA lysidine(34) synthetase TilS, partial [Chloroflexota bacterium]